MRHRLLPVFAVALAGCGFGADEASAGSGGDGSGGEGGLLGESGTGGGGRSGGTIVVDEPPSDSTSDAAVGSGTSMPYGDASKFPPAELACAAIPELVQTAHAAVDDSNSYASPMLVRELTSDSAWRVGDPLPVRAHEFLNAYGQKILGGLVDTDIDEFLHVGVDARVDPTADYLGRHLVRLAVSFTSYNAAQVAVPDVTFVMDADDSMDGEAVERLQAVVRGAGFTISPTRSVAALTTAAGGTVVRDMLPWNGPADVDALAVAAATRASDVDFGATLGTAFDIARTRAIDSQTPGVVLVVTDGNDALPEDVETRIASERSAWPPVRVVGVGVGPARSYVDDLLDRATDESGGAYFYAPSREDAESELQNRFSSLTQIAARDVRLQLDLPAGVEVVAVAGGEPEPGLDDGQNLGADSSMIFQIYLLAGDVECQTIGLSMSWKDPAVSDENAAVRTFPGDEALVAVPIWRRFSVEPTPSESFMRVEAIIAAADAMRGPTQPRIERAIQSMDDFLRAVPDDPVTVLCGPLARFCADEQLDCRVCSQLTGL